MHVPVFQILYTHRTSLRFEKCAGMLVFQGLNDATTLRSENENNMFPFSDPKIWRGHISMCAMRKSPKYITYSLRVLYGLRITEGQKNFSD